MKIDQLIESKGLYYKGAVYDKYPRGGTEPWLEKMGASAADVAEAREKVLQSSKYKDLIAMGFKDISTPRIASNGSIHVKIENAGLSPEQFVKRYPGLDPEIHGVYVYHFLVHGRITVLGSNNIRHRYPIHSPEPVIISGDPVESIYQTMTKSMQVVIDSIKLFKKQVSLLATSDKLAVSKYFSTIAGEIRRRSLVAKLPFALKQNASLYSPQLAFGPKDRTLNLLSLHSDPSSLMQAAMPNKENKFKELVQGVMDDPKFAQYFDSAEVDDVVTCIGKNATVKLRKVSKEEIIEFLTASSE